MTTLTTVEHIGFTVASLEVSIPFYTRLLGQEPFARKSWDAPYLARIGGYDEVRLEGAFFRLPGGLTLELLCYSVPVSEPGPVESYVIGNGHFAFVTTDVLADFERMRGHAELRSPDPVRIEAGPYEGGWAARMRDPDGISFELVQLPEGGPRFD
jgi:catechol 2,3-dioxygenase-like lactoylglutathione lyase family enzyme